MVQLHCEPRAAAVPCHEILLQRLDVWFLALYTPHYCLLVKQKMRAARRHQTSEAITFYDLGRLRLLRYRSKLSNRFLLTLGS